MAKEGEERQISQIQEASQDQQEYLQALQSHSLEINHILRDFPSQTAQLAALDLLYQEDVTTLQPSEPLSSELCDTLSPATPVNAPLQTFCSQNP